MSDKFSIGVVVHNGGPTFVLKFVINDHKRELSVVEELGSKLVIYKVCLLCYMELAKLYVEVVDEEGGIIFLPNG